MSAPDRALRTEGAAAETVGGQRLPLLVLPLGARGGPAYDPVALPLVSAAVAATALAVLTTGGAYRTRAVPVPPARRAPGARPPEEQQW